MIRVVLDTNVLASGFLSAGGTPGQLLSYWGEAAFDLVVSSHILKEFERTISKPYFQERFDLDQVKSAIKRLQSHAVTAVITVEVWGIASHPADDLVLATAVSAAADVLVTGDRRLREVQEHRGVTILTPREFLGQLERQMGNNSY